LSLAAATVPHLEDTRIHRTVFKSVRGADLPFDDIAETPIVGRVSVQSGEKKKNRIFF